EDELRRGIQRSRCLTPFFLSGKWCLTPFSAPGVEARGAPLRKRCLTSFSAPFSAPPQPLEERERPIERQQHHVVDRKPRQPREGGVVDLQVPRPETPGRIDDGGRVLERADPPQQRLGLEPREIG